MNLFTAIVACMLFTIHAFAGRVSGLVTNENGEPLPYASIIIKGTSRGTNANSEGRYFLNLEPGTYTLVCNYVNYAQQEKRITVTDKDLVVNFQLALQDMILDEVKVTTKTDYAYEIIRHAIARREYYKNQLQRFSCQVYTKGQLRLRNYPTRILGQKVDFEDGDTSKQKIAYLSETISTYSVEKPNKERVEVISSKVSGNQESYGLAAPRFFSFYENNVFIGSRENPINPRGFISPIADKAIYYYRFRYQGSFIEDGKLINKIKVIPRRSYEPLFEGYINIVEDDWMIHSLQLTLTKKSQMEFLDTLRLEQLYTPLDKDLWVIRSQVIYPSIKLLGFDAYGSFVNVYSEFDTNPGFGKKYFDNTLIKYQAGSNKKTEEYWESARPLPLQEDEWNDYRKRDSLEQARKDPRYLDSLDKERNKVTVMGALLFGQTFSIQKKKVSFTIRPLTEQFSFNTVEGFVINTGAAWTKQLDPSGFNQRYISLSPNLRYGFSNKHFNAHLTANYTFGKRYQQAAMLSGGRRVFQFNNASPIGPRTNSINTLLQERNLLKLYEAVYLRGSYSRGLGKGFTWTAAFQYQDRKPLENTTTFSFKDHPGREFSPNYPEELMNENFKRHQVFMTLFRIRYQPGARYIELPDQIINIGSKWPVFTMEYIRSYDKLLGSDVDFSRWKLMIRDDLNFKLRGLFSYRLGIGGFFDTAKLQVPDYQHFNGNTSTFATEYLNSFQSLPIYKYSNKARFYMLAHVEHHFNGFLTNKIPGFKKLNWHLVAGINAFYINKDTYYREFMIGLENILKQFRIDFVRSAFKTDKGMWEVKLGWRRPIPKVFDDWP
jgi:hypothetical protein